MPTNQPKHTARIDRSALDRAAREQTAHAIKDEDKRDVTEDTVEHPTLTTAVLKRLHQDHPPGPG